MSRPHAARLRDGRLHLQHGPIDLVIEAKKKDLGGFEVGRILPFAKRRMVGPFIFLDHMGPADFAPGQGINVRPHPHIGLSTVTYLFDGEIMHRDSLGFAQAIRPGEVNWMTAGRGITHSERFEDLREHGGKMHGIQAWVALPEADVLVLTETGYGKRVPLTEFRIKHRGGQGVGLISLEGRKTGDVAAVQQVTEADEELLLISAGGQVIRTETNTINRYSSSARGVIVMRLAEGDRQHGAAGSRGDDARVQARRAAPDPARAGEDDRRSRQRPRGLGRTLHPDRESGHRDPRA